MEDEGIIILKTEGYERKVEMLVSLVSQPDGDPMFRDRGKLAFRLEDEDADLLNKQEANG